jgi:predicted dehydrogenase
MTAAIDLLDASGGLGDLEFLDIHMGSAVRGLLAGLPADRTSGRHQGWQPETYHNPRLSGGGYAQSQLTHALGMGLWLAHARASRVFAITSPSATEIERHDAFVVRYATGAIGTISGTSTFRGGGPHRHQLEIRALGTGGELSLDLEMNRLSFTDPSGHRVRPRLEPQASRYRGLGPTDLIVDLALGRTGDNRSPGELGARTVELIEAAYASRRTGQPESIDAETEAAV